MGTPDSEAVAQERAWKAREKSTHPTLGLSIALLITSCAQLKKEARL